MHKTFITEYPSKFSHITPEFFELHEEEDWHNGLKINVDFEEYLKNLSDTGTRQYKVYPIKDFNVFMKAYCHLLGLTYQEYREIINYNIFLCIMQKICMAFQMQLYLLCRKMNME